VPPHDHGLVLHQAEAEEQARRLLTLRRSRNPDLPGMDPRRRETLAAAAVVVAEAMAQLEATRLITSERSLREGLLQEWVLTHRPYLLPDPSLDPRTRSVRGLAARYGADLAHAETTVRLSLSLFDQLQGHLKLSVEDRTLLGHAAYLHDIGHHISGADHNEHGAYLVRHSRLYGFTEPEINHLSLLIRYHRGSKPKKSHPDFGALPKEDRQRVSALSALLRLADGLDRSHEGLVNRLEVLQVGAEVLVQAWTRKDAHLERWATESRAGVLAEVLGCPVQVRVLAEPPAKAVPGPAKAVDLR
jgi:exopolyphosphatase/guanosine-5'-triphosphate,3'-diphosphate pyrophosphatase